MELLARELLEMGEKFINSLTEKQKKDLEKFIDYEVKELEEKIQANKNKNK